MINTFLISFNLKNAYRVNAIIYSLKRIPIVKKLLPSSLYRNKGLKIFANLCSFLWELISMFLGKFLYLSLMVFTPILLFDVHQDIAFLHIIFFLTIIGAFYNTGMLSPSRDKYYAVILMKMDARKFALTNYFYTLFRTFIGFIVCIIYFKLNGNIQIPLWLCLLIPFYICSAKLMVIQYCLKDFHKNQNVHNENNQNKYTITLMIVCLLCAYSLLFFKIALPITIFISIVGLCIVLGILSFIYILKYTEFHRLYHDLLSSLSKLLNTSSAQMVNATYRKMIILDTNLTSQKNGFEFFNEIFVKRHKRLLWRTAKRQSYIIIGLFTIAVIVISLAPQLLDNLEYSLTTTLPYSVFIMYIINTTKGITQVMFVNCDHSMLTYSFYRYPQNILALFKIRLREMVKINLLPATLIGSAIVILLLISGGQGQIINSLISFVSIIAMSIFFSTHYLVLYYLLQPYNAFTEIKNPVYLIITSLTYFVCLFFMNLKMSTLVFGITIIIFCIIYFIIACFLVLKFAEKTFKIHN